MKKVKTKPKAAPKETGPGSRGQVIKIKPGKTRSSWFSKVPPVKTYYAKTKLFLAEVVSELRKVTWPNRKETLGTTGVVIILVILVSIYLGLVDYGLSHLVRVFID